jgi:hypothetical protein
MHEMAASAYHDISLIVAPRSRLGRRTHPGVEFRWPRRRKLRHNYEERCEAILNFLHLVIPGCAKREPGIHNHHREYGFRACAFRRIPE